MKKIIVVLAILFTQAIMADSNIVTCPEWKSKQKLFAEHSKRVEILNPEAPAGFIALYRAIAAILGSKRMSAEINAELEKSGYGDLCDVLLSLHYRGGFPDEFIEALKRFQKTSRIKLDEETYVIDISTEETLSKFRRSYCK